VCSWAAVCSQEVTVSGAKINRKKNLNRFEINENIDGECVRDCVLDHDDECCCLAGLLGCRALKLQIVNIGAEDFKSGIGTTVFVSV
jgi:hypothetical protein